ncbi:hypothetical protein GGU45_002576 [Niabella hirudinis]
MVHLETDFRFIRALNAPGSSKHVSGTGFMYPLQPVLCYYTNMGNLKYRLLLAPWGRYNGNIHAPALSTAPEGRPVLLIASSSLLYRFRDRLMKWTTMPMTNNEKKSGTMSYLFFVKGCCSQAINKIKLTA